MAEVKQVTGLADSAFLKHIRDLMDENGELGNPYHSDSSTYSAARVVATNVAAVRMLVFDDPDPQARRPVTEKRGPAADLARLIKRPAPHLSERDMKKLLTIGLMQQGESNLVLRDAGLAPVRGVDEKPRFMTIHQQAEISTRKRGDMVEWLLEEKPLPEGSLLVLKNPDPDNPLRGFGGDKPAHLPTQIAHFARSYLSAFFKNGADPGGYLKTPMSLSGKQIRRMLAGWGQRHQGPNKAKKVAVLDAGLEYVIPQQSNQHMQLLELLGWARTTTLSVYGVPESEVAITSDQTYANGISANAGFWFQTILPIMLEIEEALNDPVYGIGRRFGDLYVGFDLAHVKEVLKRMGDKVDALVKLIPNGVPVNKAFEYLGMEIEAVEGGDVPLVSAGLVPLEQAIDPPEPVPPGEGKPTPDAGLEEEPPPEDRVLRALMRHRREEGKAQHVARVNAVRDEFEVEAERITRGMMLDMRAAKLEAIDSADRAVGGIRYPDAEERLQEIEDEYLRQMNGLFAESVAVAAATVEAELGRTLLHYDDQNPLVVEFVQRRTSQVRNITEQVRERLRKAVEEGVTANETPAQVKVRIKEVIQGETKRAATIARTEVGEAVNGGRFLTMRLEGVPKHEWSAFVDKATRESHVWLNGEIVEIGSRFSNGLLFPMDPDGPAEEVVNCRCVALAVPV